MGYSITYKNSVHRDLKKLDKDVAIRVLDALEKELSQKAHKYPVLKGTFAGLRKYRVGDYRVIYAIINDTVLVLRIAHRREVYR